MLALLVAAMWYAAASLGNGAAYLLFFLVTGVFLISAPHTLLNLTGLKISADSVKPTFAGQEATLSIEIENSSRGASASRHAICVSIPRIRDAAEMIDQIPPGEARRVMLNFSAPSRGQHEISAVRLSSMYPLGFLRASRCVEINARFIVYPKPAGTSRLPSRSVSAVHSGAEKSHTEGDEFAGVRAYAPGESQRHVDWKAVARGLPMMTKQFAAEDIRELHLDFAMIASGDVEQKLSQLALWVIEAERTRTPYGLRLPATRDIRPSFGEAHFHRCLRALALFNGSEMLSK